MLTLSRMIALQVFKKYVNLFASSAKQPRTRVKIQNADYFKERR